MGYTTDFVGRFKIRPALDAAQVAHLGEFSDTRQEGDEKPGLWCQWVPTDDGAALEWDGNERFYEYTPWLRRLLDDFLVPWGRTLHGAVEWQGEESDDRGVIYAEGAAVEAVKDRIVNVGPSWAAKEE